MDFKAESFNIFDKSWAVLTAGNKQDFNSMTISWGGLGTLWGKPAATVYVKPVRYTHEFMEKSDCFTISFYNEKYRNALMIFGSLSGRDCDKAAKAGFNPVFLDNAVTYKEADKTLVCKKIYRQDMDLRYIPKDVAGSFYKSEAPHTIYIGEVLEII